MIRQTQTRQRNRAEVLVDRPYTLSSSLLVSGLLWPMPANYRQLDALLVTLLCVYGLARARCDAAPGNAVRSGPPSNNFCVGCSEPSSPHLLVRAPQSLLTYRCLRHVLWLMT